MTSKMFAKVFQTSVLPANSTPTYKLLRVSEVAFIAGHNLIRSHVICKPDKTPNDKFRKQASQHDRQASSGAVCEKYIIQCLNQLHSQPQCCLRDFDLASLLKLFSDDYLFPSSSCVHSMYNTGFTPADTDSLLKINTLIFL